MSTPAKDKLSNDFADAIVEAKNSGVSEEEILMLIRYLKRDIEDYGIEGAIRPYEWIK